MARGCYGKVQGHSGPVVGTNNHHGGEFEGAAQGPRFGYRVALTDPDRMKRAVGKDAPTLHDFGFGGRVVWGLMPQSYSRFRTVAGVILKNAASVFGLFFHT